MPQALIFDVFGTLVDWRNGVAREASAFLRRYAPASDAHRFADAWRRRYAPAMAEIREGRRPFVRLDTLHRENLLAILPEFGIDPARIADSELDELNLAWHRLDPWPDTVAGLTRLKARYIVAPHSNGNIRLMIDIARRAALPWDAILGAELVRAYKPNKETYVGAVETLGLPASEVCMVAAHNYDLAAAKACGLATAFVPRPMEHGPGQTTDLEAAGPWDFIAPDMGALASQLGV